MSDKGFLPDQERKIIERYLALEDNAPVIEFIKPVRTEVKRIGSSTGFIVPPKVLEYLGFKIGDKVNLIIQMREENNEQENFE